LWALLLQVFCSVRAERLLVEKIDCGLLFLLGDRRRGVENAALSINRHWRLNFDVAQRGNSSAKCGKLLILRN